MLKQYIKRLILKEWLPLIYVFALLSLALFLIHTFSISFYPDSYQSWRKATIDFIYLLIPMSIFAVILPFFVYSYRLKIQSCDTYYQLPFSPRKLKTIRLLTGLVVLLAIYTTVFIIGFIVINVRYYTSPDIGTVEAMVYNPATQNYVWELVQVAKHDFNPFMLLVAFIMGLFCLAGLYFETCFFVSLTNSILSAVVLNILAQVFLTFLISCLATVLTKQQPYRFSTFILLSPSLFGINGMVQTFVYSFVLDPYLFEFDVLFFGYSFAIAYVLYIVNALAFAGFGVYVLLEKDPSGENAGQPATRNRSLDFIIYASAFVEILMMQSFVSSQPWYLGLIAAAIYFGYRYMISSLFFQTPKLSRNHFLLIGLLSFTLAINIWLNFNYY